MNIKEAKQEVENTVRAYLVRNEAGEYKIPVEKQRPILLIGPPGIGKTAIMEQAAADLGINLVSYTITHHTRQSAIGLPFISRRIYGGKEYSVTEYTMSEIIAAIYDQIERSGVKEGILFLDEINCVSETLAPTMLQFLQYKTFGTHRVPDGFVIVTAGNPPQYNKSVRDLDIVTLDRVKKIPVEENFDVWKEYAYRSGVHGSILAYLEIRREHFYSIRMDVEDKYFVTARGWEDLSSMITVYEEEGMPVTKNLVLQYVQDPAIAEDFSTYYELYQKYKHVYRILEILDGIFPENTDAIRNSPFDEKLSLISLLIDSLNQEFRNYAVQYDVQKELLKILTEFRNDLKSGRAGALQTDSSAAAADAAESRADGNLSATGAAESRADGNLSATGAAESRADGNLSAAGAEGPAETALRTEITQQAAYWIDRAKTGREAALRKAMSARMTGREDIYREKLLLAALEEVSRRLKVKGTGDAKSDFAVARAWFGAREQSRQEEALRAGEHLTHAFAFLDKVFGEGQEMVIFLSELTKGYYSLRFVSECGNDAYYKYNKLLLLKDRRDELRAQVLELSGLK